MRIETTLEIRPERPLAVAVGFFDGVHRGHRAVIDAALRAKTQGLDACVFSFTMSEQNAPTAKSGAKLLQSPSQKARAIEALGADWLLTPDFSLFRRFTPAQFAVEILYHTLHAQVVCCGYDYRFGKGACAGPLELAELLAPYGVTVLQIGAVLDGREPISSTRIRAALEAGDTATAARLLGRPYCIDFPVIHGNALGRTLGFPTANQPIDARFIVPKFGVYATQAVIDGHCYPAVTNVGVKPTVGCDGVAAETYLDGFSGNLYGQNLDVQFFDFLRSEQRFDSLDALRCAIRNDAEHAKALFEARASAVSR